MIIPSSVGAPLVNAYLSLGASFDRFVVVLFGIGLLYIVGQLLTHFSQAVILRPLQALARRSKQEGFANSDIDWMADYTFIRHKDAAHAVLRERSHATDTSPGGVCRGGSPTA